MKIGTHPTSLPPELVKACNALTDRTSGGYGQTKTPEDWLLFFGARNAVDLVQLGDAWAAVAYEDTTKQTVTTQSAAPKAAVRVATTAALATNTLTAGVLTASANGALAAIDGVTLALNDRVLVKNEATTSHNGIYIVTALGSGGAPWTLTRAVDANAGTELVAAAAAVTEGTTNAGHAFKQTTAGPITVDTTAIVFTRLQDLAEEALFALLPVLLPKAVLTLHPAA